MAAYSQEVVRQTIHESLRNNIIPSNRANTVPEFKEKYANIIPVFTREPGRLEYFINQCQLIVDRFVDPHAVDSFQNQEVLGTIVQRIQGQAANITSSYKFSSFEEIKEALLDTYLNVMFSLRTTISMPFTRRKASHPSHSIKMRRKF